jgi:hypothetical protein
MPPTTNGMTRNGRIKDAPARAVCKPQECKSSSRKMSPKMLRFALAPGVDCRVFVDPDLESPEPKPPGKPGRPPKAKEDRPAPSKPRRKES